MTMKVTFTASGPLHIDQLKHFRRAISQSMSDTSAYALGVLKARTPVRTGNLKNSWYGKPEGWNAFSIENSAKYAPFVERKVLMAARSRPEIQNYLARALDENIEREMN
jgi:hypothetical protein